MPQINRTGEEAPGARRSARIAAAASKGKGKGKEPANVAPKRKPGKSTTKAPVKRRRGQNLEDDEDEVEEEEEAQAPKKQRKASPAVEAKVIINQVPEQELDVYVWGCGNFNELGMLDDSRDPDVPARNVKRPLKNPLLSGPHGITHVAVGARHGAALAKTPDSNGNMILTWGSNEYGALGRITDERPRFATTRNDWRRYRALPELDTKPEWKPSTVEVDVVGEELRFSQLACGAETTFALTDTGDVFGWGCFMKKVPLELPEHYKHRFENMGVNKLVGFSENVLVQEFPIKLPELKNIRSIAAGDNHVLALDASGKLYVWGSDEQGQLGHRRMARRDKQYLKPALFRQRNTFQLIGTGRNHSFAIQKKHRKVWAWGQNDFCQTGTENSMGIVWTPALVPALSVLSIDGRFIERITGTDISSISSISDGNTLVWGCLGPNMTGLDPNSLDPAEIIRDSDEHPMMLIAPTQLKRAAKSPTFAAGGRTHNILVRNGRVFSWGKNDVYECGQGHTDEIVEPTRLITAREDEQRYWVWAGAGHQFGMLASHTRNTQRWEQSRNELRSPASAMDGQAGPPEENASSSSVPDECRPSGESPASDRDEQAELSSGNAESSLVASRARSHERSGGPTVPGIVSGDRPVTVPGTVSGDRLVPREREGPRRLMGDEGRPELELLQPGPSRPYLRGPRPRVGEPVVGRRLTGAERLRPMIEVQPGIPMPPNYSERSFGAITPSPPPPRPQRNAQNPRRSGEPTAPGGLRPVPREREASPEREAQPGPRYRPSGSPTPIRNRDGQRSNPEGSARPRVVGPVVGRRSTGPGRPRPIMEVRPGRPMPVNYSKRSLGAMTPSPPSPPGPQRDAELQWGPQRDDIDELDAAMPGWGPENRRYYSHEVNRPIGGVLGVEPGKDAPPRSRQISEPPRVRQLSAQTFPPPNRPPDAEGIQAIARRRQQSPSQSPPAPKQLPAPEETQDIVRTRRQPSPQNLVPRGRLPLPPAQLAIAEELQETLRARRQPSSQDPDNHEDNNGGEEEESDPSSTATAPD